MPSHSSEKPSAFHSLLSKHHTPNAPGAHTATATHSSSPSKDQSTKHVNARRPSSHGTSCGASIASVLMNRKYVLALALSCAILWVVVQQSPLMELAHNMDRMNQRSTKATEKNPIRLIAILGERNSGTRWTFDHISKCFNHSVEVRKGLTRYKHWFQHHNVSKYPADTLVLAQFRNAYDWLKAMEHVPHHAPAHIRTARGANTKESTSQNDWRVFLTKPWTTPRVGLDLQLPRDTLCQEDFMYKDIISCVEEPLPHSAYNYTLRYSENQPFYEMRNDGSGRPYDNILDMRTDKIRNFLLDVPTFPGVADVWTLQYEYLVLSGTQQLVDRIAEWTGIAPKCTGIAAQNRPTKSSRMVRADMAEHVRTHLNWTVERWLGYQPEFKYEESPWRRRLHATTDTVPARNERTTGLMPNRFHLANVPDKE